MLIAISATLKSIARVVLRSFLSYDLVHSVYAGGLVCCPLLPLLIAGSFSKCKGWWAFEDVSRLDASNARLIDAVVRIPCSPMVNILGCTLTMGNGAISLSINLL